MRVFHCDHCGHLVFFENIRCVSCGHKLAYWPELMDMTSLEAIDETRFRSPAVEETMRLCANYTQHDVCNWALTDDDPNALCRSCRLTTTIPNLAREGNQKRWYKLEIAKRRLVYTLEELGLPITAKSEDPAGLAFQFLEDPEPGVDAPKVMTGHADGVITVNISEADDAERVRTRVELKEPYRTLLGHFRHESGHYYWDRLIANTPRIEAFRELFGDERADYGEALRKHYDAPREDWQNDFVSAYATMHPWEDWAETWAHYLHITDALETSWACGVQLKPRRSDEPTLPQVADPVADVNLSFDRITSSWTAIAYMLNNLTRSLGGGDAYPFVLAPEATKKLRFVHDTIAKGGDPRARRRVRRRAMAS